MGMERSWAAAVSRISSIICTGGQGLLPSRVRYRAASTNTAVLSGIEACTIDMLPSINPGQSARGSFKPRLLRVGLQAGLLRQQLQHQGGLLDFRFPGRPMPIFVRLLDLLGKRYLQTLGALPNSGAGRLAQDAQQGAAMRVDECSDSQRSLAAARQAKHDGDCKPQDGSHHR